MLDSLHVLRADVLLRTRSVRKPRGNLLFVQMSLCMHGGSHASARDSGHRRGAAHTRGVARGQGYTLFLTATEAVFAFGRRPGMGPQRLVLRMRLVGANPQPRVNGLAELPGKRHYLLGNYPRAWHTSVSTYTKVAYHDVYPWEDLLYYGNQE